MLRNIGFLLKKLIVGLINIYQKTLSPDHGWGRFISPRAGCIFYPSCSEYTKQAVIKYDIKKGLWMGIKRLLRCRPGQVGGVDFV